MKKENLKLAIISHPECISVYNLEEFKLYKNFISPLENKEKSNKFEEAYIMKKIMIT